MTWNVSFILKVYVYILKIWNSNSFVNNWLNRDILAFVEISTVPAMNRNLVSMSKCRTCIHFSSRAYFKSMVQVLNLLCRMETVFFFLLCQIIAL